MKKNIQFTRALLDEYKDALDSEGEEVIKLKEMSERYIDGKKLAQGGM